MKENLLKHFDVFLLGFVAGILFIGFVGTIVILNTIGKERRKLNKMLEELEK